MSKSRSFILLSHKQFTDIIALLDNANDKEIKSILKTATHTTASPVKDGMRLQAILYDNNILVDMSGEL